MNVPSPREPSHGDSRWATVSYALSSNVRTARLCLYRLMPPRRRSELRETLDGATGRGQDDRDDVPAAGPVLAGPPAGRKRARPRLAPFFGGVLSNALGGILTAIALAVAAYLWAHLHHAGHSPAQYPPTPPAATATAHPVGGGGKR